MRTDPEAKTLLQKVYEFIWVYFDEKTAKNIQRHPSQAIPLIKDAIKHGSLSKPRLSIYGEALQNAVAYQTLLTKM